MKTKLKIEEEFVKLNDITLVKLASALYQFIKDKDLLIEFVEYIKCR